jgi:hypothetical protein
MSTSTKIQSFAHLKSETVFKLARIVSSVTDHKYMTILRFLIIQFFRLILSSHRIQSMAAGQLSSLLSCLSPSELFTGNLLQIIITCSNSTKVQKLHLKVNLHQNQVTVANLLLHPLLLAQQQVHQVIPTSFQLLWTKSRRQLNLLRRKRWDNRWKRKLNSNSCSSNNKRMINDF